MIKIQPAIKYSYILTLLVFAFFLSSCLTPPNNDIKDESFENEFLSKIKRDSATYFDYQYDGLTPQKSFFIDNKLKYLTFRHGPEVGFVECRITFDLTSDSIEKYTLREVLPKFQKDNNEKIYDTIFVFYPKRHVSEIYYDNKLISTTYRQDVFTERLKFIYELKSRTQDKFNSR